MVRVPCPQAKFSLRLSPQPWADGRTARLEEGQIEHLGLDLAQLCGIDQEIR